MIMFAALLVTSSFLMVAVALYLVFVVRKKLVQEPPDHSGIRLQVLREGVEHSNNELQRELERFRGVIHDPRFR